MTSKQQNYESTNPVFTWFFMGFLAMLPGDRGRAFDFYQNIEKTPL
jgi:hypothetical protein